MVKSQTIPQKPCQLLILVNSEPTHEISFDQFHWDYFASQVLRWDHHFSFFHGLQAIFGLFFWFDEFFVDTINELINSFFH